jgi:AcrR family transcriptional regulator
MRATSTNIEELHSRRQYDSPVRRKRAAETRERIVAAGSALVHSFATWDWNDLTFRAVAEKAGVSESTVYRHFASERELHDAVMYRLQQEAGVSYEGMTLDELPETTRRVFASLSAYAVSAWTRQMDDPTLVTADRVRMDALLGAVGEPSASLSSEQRQMAAAMLDVLWSVPSYERLVTQWKLDGEQATAAITWVMGLIVGVLRDGPTSTPIPGHRCLQADGLTEHSSIVGPTRPQSAAADGISVDGPASGSVCELFGRQNTAS